MLNPPGSYCAYASVYLTVCLIRIFGLATKTYLEQQLHVGIIQVRRTEPKRPCYVVRSFPGICWLVFREKLDIFLSFCLQYFSCRLCGVLRPFRVYQGTSGHRRFKHGDPYMLYISLYISISVSVHQALCSVTRPLDCDTRCASVFCFGR